MLDTMKEFLKTLWNVVWLILSSCWMLLVLVFLPFPLNFVIALLPLYVGITRYRNEVLRIARLGFVYDRVREIPEEQVQKAFEEIEKQRKKSKPL